MGSSWFTTQSRGKSVQSAYDSAVERAEEQYGHQEGYSGEINSSSGCRDVTKEWKASKKTLNQFVAEQQDKLSKHQGAQAICLEEPKANENKTKSQVQNIVTPGTKKWILKYEVMSDETGKFICSCVTKTEAVKKARAFTEKHEETTRVTMKKVLEKGDAKVATIRYKKSSTEKDGIWLFFGWASY